MAFKRAEKLHESDRTPDGYAASFGEYFSADPDLLAEKPGWMSLANASVQYAAATVSGKKASQLVKRMHYVSFVGMLRPDLFEGLCVGHAPRKCPICGTWFLTTDARPTEYCGGLAPGDKRGRTCRQVGNLRGREQREQADDHPLKKVSQPDCAVCTSAYHSSKDFCDCFWAELQVYSQASLPEPVSRPLHRPDPSGDKRNAQPGQAAAKELGRPDAL